MYRGRSPGVGWIDVVRAGRASTKEILMGLEQDVVAGARPRFGTDDAVCSRPIKISFMLARPALTTLIQPTPGDRPLYM
ncbi:MAG: hypothetical protein AAGM27_11275, partial [Cyanobacteria bacterium J06554_3]